MSTISDAGSQVEKLQIRGLVGLSYYTIGIVGACIDFLLIAASSVCVDYFYQLRSYSAGSNLNAVLGIGTVVALIFVLTGKINNIYSLTSLLSPSNCLSKILLTWATSILLVTAMLFLLRAGSLFSRGSTVIFAVVTFIPLVSLRLAFARTFHSLIVQGALSGRRVVLVGEERELTRLNFSSLLLDFGLTELARVSIGDGSNSNVLSQGELVKLNEAITVARKQDAEEFVIVCDWSRTELVKEIGDRLRISPLPVRLIPDRVVRSAYGRGNFSTRGSIPSIELQRAPLTWAERLTKRVCDVVIAMIALVLLVPLMILTALAIKLDTRGPVIFKQRRTGFNGSTFFIYKFRTMSVMEDGPQIAQTTRNDPRVTRVGRFLRRSSIDELPQLFNVLKGDMSLVGPRPHAVAHDDHYGAVVSKYAYRHHVKPGITGWAQVNGRRGETRHIEDMEKRIELDLWYINNWTILLDFRIMWRTCLEVVREPAY